MKIKIFLGAYVNFPNAQNVNCDNIAKHLDKDKFEVHIMYTHKLPVKKKEYKEAGIHLHRLYARRLVWYWHKYLTMLFGKYDIYYLPKLESADLAFARKYRKTDALFVSSVEGVVGEQVSGDDPEVFAKYDAFDDCFSISGCIAQSVKEYWAKNSKVLYLGIAPKHKTEPKKTAIKNVVWVGSIIDRKRPELLLECAKAFPQLQFTMIGDGDMQDWVRQTIQKENLQNVRLTGRIPNEQVYDYMQESDLLLMTSKFEGLPKVIGEGMFAGVPAIYINEAYTVDYIKDGENGFAVPNVEGMKETVQKLLDDPALYQRISTTAYETIQDYTWDKLIKQYEDYFIAQLEKKRKGR